MRKPILLLLAVSAHCMLAGVVFNREFSPLEGMVAPQEKPFRQEICLNGLWQFQPIELPSDWIAGKGAPPTLRLPEPNGWETTPIKIPSPWNVNAVLHDAKGEGMDSRAYPSYPEGWNSVKMGWLRKQVTIPESWSGQRIYLHLEAVAGDCRVLVNGNEAGTHFDTSLPGAFDITALVKQGQPNEILLGIRDHRLYAEPGTYGRMTYPTGSFWLSEAIGVWQDVFLLAKPQIHVSDIFMQPLLEQDLLVAEIELVNHTDAWRGVQVELPIYEWINHTDLSKANVLQAPEIAWSLGEEALRLKSGMVMLQPGERKIFRLQTQVAGRLKKWELWNRGQPNLYMAIAEVRVNAKEPPIDCKCQRFGWREVKLAQGDFWLNGERVKLAHEFWHCTGVANMSRRYAWSWYTLAKDANVNYIRPHAMPFPRYFYDMGDEMGMLLIDESGVFGSHCDFNYDSAEFWQRNREHIERLVRRDRNHPSILGWSVANEIWCVLRSRAPAAQQEEYYDKIFDLCKLARSLDPTRQWVQSDGDKDLNGRLELWTIHCASEQSDVIPPNKLWGVTEGGSAYFGKPGYYKEFAGDRVYRSFDDRLDGLGKECFHLIRTLREQDADIYSAVNLVWHGLKPLALGLKDSAVRKLELSDGIFFGPYVEGKPGVQPERLAPFSTTVNPGYDPALPLYVPNALYLALKAAMHPGGPQPCRWDHFEDSPMLPEAPAIKNPVDRVAFAGKSSGTIYENLKSMGVPFDDDDASTAKFLIIDISSVDPDELEPLKKKAELLTAAGGSVLLVGMAPQHQAAANRILPHTLTCVKDAASSLVPNLKDPRTACLSYEELYFAESYINKVIAGSSLGGDFVKQGRTLLSRNNTDWQRWLNGPEYTKTISIVRSELENSQTPVVVELSSGKGTYLVSTLEMAKMGEEHAELYRKLLANLGVKLEKSTELTVPAFDGDALICALTLGRFGADSLEAGIAKEFIAERSSTPQENDQAGGSSWKKISNAGDRFIFNQMQQDGPEKVYTVYFSYWVHSPINLGDLLNAGPDLPQVTKLCYASDQAKVYLNGKELEPAHSQSVDYRTLLTFEKIQFKQGWNHFLVKVTSDSLHKADPGTLAMRLFSNNQSYNKQLKSAVALPQQ